MKNTPKDILTIRVKRYYRSSPGLRSNLFHIIRIIKRLLKTFHVRLREKMELIVFHALIFILLDTVATDIGIFRFLLGRFYLTLSDFVFFKHQA